MWLSPKIFAILEVSKESADAMRTELTALRAENAVLKTQLAETNANFRWLSTRVNALEYERAQLLEQATHVKTTVPEIVLSSKPKHPVMDLLSSDLFNDPGDEEAKKLGYEV